MPTICVAHHPNSCCFAIEHMSSLGTWIVETTSPHPQVNIQPTLPGEDLAVSCRLFARPEEADGVGLEQAELGTNQVKLQPSFVTASVYLFDHKDWEDQRLGDILGWWFCAKALIPPCHAVKLYMSSLKSNKASCLSLLLWSLIFFGFVGLLVRDLLAAQEPW